MHAEPKNLHTVKGDEIWKFKLFVKLKTKTAALFNASSLS